MAARSKTDSKPAMDCLIIGAGPAGLSVATALARQLYQVVVFDSGEYRNDPATHMHNVATWDHRPPAEYREAGRKAILDRYDTVHIENTKIATVERTAVGQFLVKDTKGVAWIGKKLVLATGSREILPDIPGYADCWATGIYVCLFCHGYEDRGAKSAGILAIGENMPVMPTVVVARMAKRLAEDVTIYTNGNESVAEEYRKVLARSSIKIDTMPIERLEKGKEKGEVIIHFKDVERQVTEGFIVHRPKTELVGPFAQQLGLELTPGGDIKVMEPMFTTNVPGVFAAGDCVTPMKAVVQAMATGAFCAGGVSAMLSAEMYG